MNSEEVNSKIALGLGMVEDGLASELSAGPSPLRNFRKFGAGWDLGGVAMQACQYDHLFAGARADIREGEIGYTHKDAKSLVLRYADIPWDALTNPEAAARVQDDLIARNRSEWHLFTSLHPPIHELMRRVNGTHLGGVMLIRLPPGGIISPHYDKGLSAEHFTRYHIVVSGPRGCWFYCGEGDDEERLEMLDGEVWSFNALLLHSVKNRSDKTRLSVSIDISSS